jgi:hypothetical protein
LGFGTRKVSKLAPVLGNILDMDPKCRFIGDDAIGTIKIGLHPIGHRFAQAPATPDPQARTIRNGKPCQIFDLRCEMALARMTKMGDDP